MRMVDEVERFGSELESSLLIDRERLEQSEVPVLESRLVDQIAHASVIERSGRRLDKDRRTIRVRCGEPLAG